MISIITTNAGAIARKVRLRTTLVALRDKFASPKLNAAQKATIPMVFISSRFAVGRIKHRPALSARSTRHETVHEAHARRRGRSNDDVRTNFVRRDFDIVAQPSKIDARRSIWILYAGSFCP